MRNVDRSEVKFLNRCYALHKKKMDNRITRRLRILSNEVNNSIFSRVQIAFSIFFCVLYFATFTKASIYADGPGMSRYISLIFLINSLIHNLHIHRTWNTRMFPARIEVWKRRVRLERLAMWRWQRLFRWHWRNQLLELPHWMQPHIVPLPSRLQWMGANLYQPWKTLRRCARLCWQLWWARWNLL